MHHWCRGHTGWWSAVSLCHEWSNNRVDRSAFSWQPRHAIDTSMNYRQSLFCWCTASMEQATDGAETAAIDGLILL